MALFGQDEDEMNDGTQDQPQTPPQEGNGDVNGGTDQPQFGGGTSDDGDDQDNS